MRATSWPQWSAYGGRNRLSGPTSSTVLEVVDGQQRLTTLIILLNAIKLALNCKDKAEAKLARELSELLVKVEGDELLLLQTNHDSSHYFATFLGVVARPGANR